MPSPEVVLVLDLLLRSCLIVSVSSFLIMLALQPLLLLPAGGNVATAGRGVCSASRAALARLLSLSVRRRGADDVGDGGGGGAAVVPPPTLAPRQRRHCERCAASPWPDAVAAVTASLRLDDGGGGMECSDDDGMACGGCAAMAAVEELLERKEATERELREAFYVFDRDEDGFVGAGELWNVLRRLGMLPAAAGEEEDCCARMIAAHDGDGDGRISFREFRAMMGHAV